MKLDVIKDKRFYSQWPMKDVSLEHVRQFYEGMGYTVKKDNGKMYLSRPEK